MIYEMICPNNHVTEKMCKVAQRHEPTTCHCGEQTKLKISAPRFHLDGTDPGFPDAYDKFARQHEKAALEPEKENLTHI